MLLNELDLRQSKLVHSYRQGKYSGKSDVSDSETFFSKLILKRELSLAAGGVKEGVLLESSASINNIIHLVGSKELG